MFSGIQYEFVLIIVNSNAVCEEEYLLFVYNLYYT